MAINETDPLGTGATELYVAILRTDVNHPTQHKTILRKPTHAEVVNAPCWSEKLSLSKSQWDRHFAQVKKRYYRCDDASKTRREAWVYKVTKK